MSIYSFIHKKIYEKIEYIVRRHYITFIPYILLFVVLMLVPAGVYFLINNIAPEYLTGPISFPLLVLFASAYYLSLYIFFYAYFVSFYLDMWIITNDRLVDVRQITLFARSVAEVDLYQVQDVKSEINGFWASLFNYGTVTLQTAGHIPHFILYNVPNPNHLREVILTLAAEDKKYHAQQANGH